MHTCVEIGVEPSLDRESSIGKSALITIDAVPSAKAYCNPNTGNVSMRVYSATADYVSRATLIDYAIHAIGVNNADIRWAIGSVLASEHLIQIIKSLNKKTYCVIYHDGAISIKEVKKNVKALD